MLPLYRLLPLLLVGWLIAAVPSTGQITGCDNDPSCTGNMLTIDVTSGRNAEFVEVDNRAPLNNLRYAFTFQAWLLPQEQPGRRAFVAGLWGPNQDANDQWVIFIEGTRITFELNNPNSSLGRLDNTIVTADIPDLYTRGWLHLTAAWDSVTTTARIYVDGFRIATDSNATYPLRSLHRTRMPSLLTQIGSTNALYDNENLYRTFLGNIDEVRIWDRALSDQNIRCRHDLSHVGNEPGLILYYRFNDNRATATLCDAAGRGHTGRLRNAIDLDTNDRVMPEKFSVTPRAITTPLACTADTTFTFRLNDTSFCGSDITLQMIGRDSALFQLSATSMTLTQNAPRTVTARLSASITGQIDATLRIRNVNRCGASFDIPITVTRTTELSYSQTRVALDTLYVDCIERTYEEDTIEICNTQSRPMAVRSASVSNTQYFSARPEDPSRPLPRTLAPGECWKVIVRAVAADTTRTVYDTLRIDSDDRCPGSGRVPLQSHTQDVIVLLGNGGRLDRGALIDFGRVCPNQISDVQLYSYRNYASDTAFIDSIYFGTSEFFARRRAYPLRMPSLFAFQPDFMRFRPTSGGVKNDTLFVRGTYKGCTIIKKFAVTGYGIDVDNGFDRPNVSFGNVTIGKTGTQTVNAFNDGDPARFTAYLKVGDVFRITSARSFTMPTGGTQPVTLEFQPREAITYYDTLCIFDQQCLGTTCIPISGTGVFDALAFDPAYVLFENIVGCRCALDTIEVENVSGGPFDFTTTFPTIPQLRVTGPTTGTIAAGGTMEYIVEYCPNDLANDRADADYITIDLSDGQRYEILVRASSAVPRLFVEPLTTFGVVEAGWQVQRRILVENISSVPIRIPAGGVSVPAGYALLGTVPALPIVLGPRDSLWVDVEFRPTAEAGYNDSIRVLTDDPCPITWAGAFEGEGVIKRLDVPVTFINFGLAKPCECTEREIPLPNGSEFIPMTIDSIWIDSAGLTNPNPRYFSWYSRRTGASTLPYTIPPQTSDTIVVRFCPTGPSDTSKVINNAQIHIGASGTDARGVEIWNEAFATTISGRREIFFISNRGNNIVSFGRPRTVGTTTPTNVQIRVPDQFLNPSGDSVIITDVTFQPDDRVFTAQANTGVPFPWVIRRGENFRIDLNFSPRAPRTYRAKMVLHMAHPCAGVDSTIEVVGSGYAANYGWPTAIDTARSTQDTFRLSICDTLVLPVMARRAMPQDNIDILFRVGYDTASLTPLDVISPYTGLTSFVDTGTGMWAKVRKMNGVGPGTFAFARFLVKGGSNAFRLDLDNFDFDSDSLVEYLYITEIDDAWIIVDQPMIAVSGPTDFDTVNVKTCEDQQVTVWNPGILPVQFDSLALPKDHRVTASTIPYPVTLQPGDSITLTVTYCPTEERIIDTLLYAYATAPCVITDSAALRGFGYAPPWPITLEIAENPVTGIIADTITTTLRTDTHMPVAPVDLTFSLAYNRRALQYLDFTTPYAATATATEGANGLAFAFTGIDSLGAGDLATLRFVVAVPDTIASLMRIDSSSIGFRSDSIFFIKPVPRGDTSDVLVDPRCNITQLRFRPGLGPKLSAPLPNPAHDRVTITLSFIEDAPARLALFDAAGREIRTYITGGAIMSGGEYRIEIDVSDLPSGDYFYQFEANAFRASERLRIVR